MRQLIGKKVWILVCLACLETHETLLDFLKPCEHNENLSRCSRQVIEEMRPHLVNGIPQLHLKSIDPLRVEKISRTQRNSNVADYRLNLTNVELTGSRGFEIQDITIDPDSIVIRLKLVFPWLRFTCDADVDGVVLGFSMLGTGGYSVNYSNVILDVIVNGQPYWQNGKEFIKWEREDIGVGYDETYFTDMHGLFEDPSVTQIFKIAINRSIRLLGTSMRAAIELSIGNFIVEAIDSVHRVLPKDVLYRTAQ